MSAAKDKMESPKRNFEMGDLVLIADDRAARNDWPMARIVHTYPDAEGNVCSVRVTTGTTLLDRPVHKLVLILEKDALRPGLKSQPEEPFSDITELCLYIFFKNFRL